MAKSPQPAQARKKVVVQWNDGATASGYVALASPGHSDILDLLTDEGEHKSIEMSSVRCIYFVADFAQPHQPARKTFLSRPKMQGLWIRLMFRDGDTLEGVASNDLLDIFDNGIQITPPSLSGNCQRIFIPRSALAGATVLGVVGIFRRQTPRSPAPASAQRELFEKDKT
jgi:hypothetical protein